MAKKEKIEHNSKWLIEIFQVNFLAYSYAYYFLNESLVEDSYYDRMCNRLVELMKDDKKLAKTTRYFNLCKGLDDSASGFYIKQEDYPQEVVDIVDILIKQRDESRDNDNEEL